MKISVVPDLMPTFNQGMAEVGVLLCRVTGNVKGSWNLVTLQEPEYPRNAPPDTECALGQ
jgi:hypothetical protein